MRPFALRELIKAQGSSPSLEIDFTLGQMLPSFVTFTRASSGGRTNASGLYEVVGVNEPRFDYSPGGVALGLLVEEQRTNLLLQSGWAGATTGSPGAAPTSWSVGFGTGTETTLVDSIFGSEDGAQAIRFNADSGERVMFQQTINVTNGVQYAVSVELEDVSGTVRDIVTAVAGTATITINQAVRDPSTTGKKTHLFTATSTGTVTLRVGVGCLDSLPSTGYATLSRPQVEVGPFATSYIPTTTAAATRAADNALILPGPRFNHVKGTFVVKWRTPVAGQMRYLMSVQAGTNTSNRYDINVNASNIVNPRTVISGLARATLAGGVYTAGASAAIAFAYEEENYGSSLNGAASVTANTAGSLPAGMDTIYLGGLSGNGSLSGHIEEFLYYEDRLPSAAMEELTA